MKECCIEWLKGSDTATVTAYSNSRLKGRIEKLAKAMPDDVKIIEVNRDGSILARIPVKFVKVNKPRAVSEEQRRATAERFASLRQCVQMDDFDFDDDVDEDTDLDADPFN